MTCCCSCCSCCSCCCCCCRCFCCCCRCFCFCCRGCCCCCCCCGCCRRCRFRRCSCSCSCSSSSTSSSSSTPRIHEMNKSFRSHHTGSFPHPNAGDSAKIQSGAEAIEAEKTDKNPGVWSCCQSFLGSYYLGCSTTHDANHQDLYIFLSSGFFQTLICC